MLEHFSYCRRAAKASLNQALASSAVRPLRPIRHRHPPRAHRQRFLLQVWLFRKLLHRQHVKQRFTRPYTPRTNGKAERFIQTALREWAYARSYQDSDERRGQLGVRVA